MPLNKDKGLSEIIKAYLKEREEKGSPSIRALLEMLLDTLMKGKKETRHTLLLFQKLIKLTRYLKELIAILSRGPDFRSLSFLPRVPSTLCLSRLESRCCIRRLYFKKRLPRKTHRRVEGG